MNDNDNFDTAFDDDSFDLDNAPQSSTEGLAAAQDLDFFNNIPVQLSLEVGSTAIPLSKLMSATEETVIELDKLNGQPLDIKVNGKLFGYGEVVVSNNKYGLRITEILQNTKKQ